MLVRADDRPGLIGPNGGALACDAVPEHPGTGSALLEFVQRVAAGTIAPIAGLGGEHTAVPMALLVIGCAVPRSGCSSSPDLAGPRPDQVGGS